MSYLIMRRGPEPGKIIPIVGDEITIGRGAKNDFIINDNEVSRDHLRFVKVIGGYELYDQSTNGTYVNGQPVEGVWELRSRCIIELGDSITLEYRLGDPTDPRVAAGTDELGRKSGQFYLVVTVNDRDETTVYPLDDDVIGVGRATSNDIVVVEPELSRNHFRLTRTKKGYTVEDLDSTNGTMVNGEQITKPRLLYADDVITIGTMIHIQVTRSSDDFTPMKTGPLNQVVTTPLGKRRTSSADMAGLDDMMRGMADATSIGTGLDDVSLEDQILVTYSREDWNKVVAPLVNHLYNAEVPTWVDQYLIEGSGDWLSATEQARLECWLLVVVVSPNAMKSELVLKNWRHFQNREKPIILLMSEPIEKMPIGARKLTRIEYNPGVPHLAFQQLSAEIKRRQPQG